MLSPFEYRSRFTEGDGTLLAWAQRWIGELIINVNNSVQSIPGPFANDAAASTGKVQIGKPYYKSDGSIWVRLT